MIFFEAWFFKHWVITVEVSKAIESRRSINIFDPECTISESEVHELIKAANHSPSAFNIQHWRFVWLRDEAVQQQAKEACWFQPQVIDASATLLICMDFKAWQKQPERYWQNAPAEVAEAQIRNSQAIYANNPQLEREEGVRSASMAAMAIMIKAMDMGYESCAMACDVEKMGAIIHLPEDHAICMALAIGKRLKEPFPRPGLLSVDDVLVVDKF